MRPTDRLWHLTNMPALKALGAMDLAALSVRMTECRLRPEEVLAAAEGVHFIKSGRMRLERRRAGGEPMLIDVLGPGDIFGLVEGDDPEGPEYRATAIDHVFACTIPEGQFRELCADNPNLQVRLLRWTGRRLARVESRLEDLVFRPLGERLPLVLAELAGRIGWPAEGGEVVPLSQADIARLAGASREATSRALSTLRKQGLLETQRGRVVWKGAAAAGAAAAP